MREDISVRVADPSGVYLDEIVGFGSREGSGLDYVMQVGKPSACRLTIPSSIDDSIFKLDGRLGIWRTAGGYGPFLETGSEYLIRKWEYTRTATTVTAYHANSLFSRRFVLYNKSSAFANKSTLTAADNLIKDVWAENAGSSISSADRDGADTNANISTYVGVQADLTQAATIAAQLGRRNVADAIAELAEAAGIAGEYLTAEIVTNGSALELRTYTVARGKDRRVGAEQLILSEESGTLEEARLTVDHTDEKTVVIAVGAGDDSLRLVQEAVDSTRMNSSPLNRIEHVINLSNIADDTALLNAARAELRKHEPVTFLTGVIPQGTPLIRGVDYDYGDLVLAEMRNRQYECRLDSIRCSIGPNSRSTQILLRSLTS